MNPHKSWPFEIPYPINHHPIEADSEVIMLQNILNYEFLGLVNPMSMNVNPNNLKKTNTELIR